MLDYQSTNYLAWLHRRGWQWPWRTALLVLVWLDFKYLSLPILWLAAGFFGQFVYRYHYPKGD